MKSPKSGGAMVVEGWTRWLGEEKTVSSGVQCGLGQSPNHSGAHETRFKRINKPPKVGRTIHQLL
jgi:hypothetical protein